MDTPPPSRTIPPILTKFLSWVHLTRIHYILPGFLMLPTFQGHRSQTLIISMMCSNSYWADLHQFFIMGIFNQVPSRITMVFDLTYFSRSQRSNFEIQHLNYWADLHQFSIADTSNKDTSHITQVFDLTYFSMSQRSNFEIFMMCSTSFMVVFPLPDGLLPQVFLGVCKVQPL
jgi:hypothetical protein